MTQAPANDTSAHVYRIEQFVVPQAAREEFFSRIKLTYTLMRTLPGFCQDMILERPADDGASNVMTIVEWESEEAVANARPILVVLHAEVGFDVRETLTRLGIQADQASFTSVGI